MEGDMTAWLAALTDFGDVAVLIPVVGAMLIWLLLVFSRAALRWMLAVSFCVGFTALLKVAFYGCPPAGLIYSPSGHTSLSTLVYGALTLVTATAGPGLRRRLLAICVGAGLIFAIAVSRLLVNAHNVPEVSLGFVIGSASLALFGQRYLEGPIAKVWPLLLAAGVLVSIFHGRELHAEQFLHRITGYLQIHCS
jgi:membrane-associated phospholipid phosphatase